MKRRNFFKLLSVPFALPLVTIADENIPKKLTNIEIIGPLDDDLIIIKNDKDINKIIECHQMHNFNKYFAYNDKLWETTQSPGFINFSKDFNLKFDDIYLISTANEREDVNDQKTLNLRTHYKSAPLYINKKEFFPSVLPEKDDIAEYPLWYGKEEDGAEYNYYQLWENAVVNCGLLFTDNRAKEIFLIDSNDELISQSKIKPTAETKRAVFNTIRNVKINLNNHEFTEVDNTVFEDGKKMNDSEIRRNAIYKIAIKDLVNNSFKTILLPYPLPYINRIFFRSVEV